MGARENAVLLTNERNKLTSPRKFKFNILSPPHFGEYWLLAH